jgi:hypothetical protein
MTLMGPPGSVLEGAHMTRTSRTTAGLVAAGALALAPLTLVAPAQALADVEHEFGCNGARIEFSVERAHGKYEVEVKVDETAPGARWKIVLKQNGPRFHRSAQRADDEGEIDIAFRRPNTSGKDVFKVRVSQLGDDICLNTITVR